MSEITSEQFRGCFNLLCFILVYGDPNADQYGSYLLRQGRSRAYSVRDEVRNRVFARHRAEDVVSDEEDWRFWEAAWEIMDLAQARWERVLLRNLVPAKGPSHVSSARPAGSRR